MTHTLHVMQAYLWNCTSRDQDPIFNSEEKMAPLTALSLLNGDSSERK